MSAITHQIVVFRLAEEEYAFGVADVHEIIGPAAPRPVSSPDPWVRGIISLRGASSPCSTWRRASASTPRRPPITRS